MPEAARHQGKFFQSNKYAFIAICYIYHQKAILVWEYYR